MQFEVNEGVNFYGVIRNADNLLAILKAVDITDNASCFIHEDGMVITAEKARTVKAIAYIKSNLFHVYNIKEDVEMSAFGMSIDTVKSCFACVMPKIASPFGNKSFEPILTFDSESNYCEITYDGTGSLFGLRRTAKDKNQHIQCTMLPFEPEEESEDLKFTDTQNTPQKIVLPAKWFKEVLEELESSTKNIEITLSTDEISFQVIGEGADGIQDSHISKDSELITSFVCDCKSTYFYLYSHIMLCTKALSLASEISIEMHMNGALRFIIKVMSPDQAENFIEFYFLPSTSFT